MRSRKRVLRKSRRTKKRKSRKSRKSRKKRKKRKSRRTKIINGGMDPEPKGEKNDNASWQRYEGKGDDKGTYYYRHLTETDDEDNSLWTDKIQDYKISVSMDGWDGDEIEFMKQQVKNYNKAQEDERKEREARKAEADEYGDRHWQWW
jgi:hypothetical protein